MINPFGNAGKNNEGRKSLWERTSLARHSLYRQMREAAREVVVMAETRREGGWGDCDEQESRS